MALSSLQLEAFLELARTRSFTTAARRLHITQSALSQRILNLEETLKLNLVLRHTTGPELSEVGERFLRYCQRKEALENELLEGLLPGNGQDLSGLVRIGGFSTFVRSLLMPRLGRFYRRHPKVQVEVLTRELRDLPLLLRKAQVDFIFCNERIEKQEFENHEIGLEENVLIESRLHACPNDVFLDHDEEDLATAEFLKIQKDPPKKYRRLFFDEAYALIDGVKEGFGRAVVAKHLISSHEGVRIVKGFRSLKVPIYLVHVRSDFETQLHREMRKALTAPFASL